MDPVTGLPISCSIANTVGTTTVTTTQSGSIPSPAFYQQHSASTPCLTLQHLYQGQGNTNLTHNNQLANQDVLNQHQSNPSLFPNQGALQNSLLSHNSYPGLNGDQNSGAANNNNSWQIVRNNKRKSITNETSSSLKLKLKRYEPYTNQRPLITPSQYEPIAVDDDDAMADDTEPNSNNTPNQGASRPLPTTQQTPPPPPPVFIHGVTDYQQMRDSISTALPETEYITRTLANNTVKINPKTVDGYRALVRYLRSKNIVFHTYQIKQERAYRVVLRHIHHSIPTSEIKADLETQGFQVRNIMNITSHTTKSPLNLFFVDLEPE